VSGLSQPDVIALANFFVSYENLEVNKKILESNLKHFQDVASQSERQEQLLIQIVSLLKEQIK